MLDTSLASPGNEMNIHFNVHDFQTHCQSYGCGLETGPGNWGLMDDLC
jgi:hypothetical protein